MITVENLSKRYGSTTAVHDVSFTVEPGSITGFLGPNGAGKSTTLRMLTGLTPPTSGRATITGKRYAELPNPGRVVGVMLDAAAQHPGRTGRETLQLNASLLGVPKTRADQMLEAVGLSSAAKRRVGQYSLGMRQRLGLAAALLRPRELLVLDEPTNGLDPQGTREVRHLLREASAEGSTVFVSSHLLSEIEQVCTDVGVMSHGRLVFQGSLPELRAAAGVRVRVETSMPEAAATVLTRLGTGRPELRPDGVVAELGTVPSDKVTADLVAAGIDVRQLVVERPDLEDLFVALTGEGFDVDE